jgi:hypothetical protein
MPKLTKRGRGLDVDKALTKLAKDFCSWEKGGNKKKEIRNRVKRSVK